MKMPAETLFSRISHFVNFSSAGLVQLLVAAANRSTYDRIINCPSYPAPAGTAGLSEAVRNLHEVMQDRNTHLPTLFFELYSSVRSVNHRKRSGQFFTSREIAEWMFAHAKPRKNEDICDAGAGTGVFGDALLRKKIVVRSYVGVESDPVLALCAAHVLESLDAPNTYKIWYANFMLLNEAAFKSQGLNMPSLVVSNPPFVRYHKLVGRARIRTALKSSLGIMLSPLSGSLAYFLVRAAELVQTAREKHPDKAKPRLLFLLPQEASGAAYVQHLRDDLRRIYGWTCREHEIPNLDTNRDRSNALALFFLFEKEKVSNEPPMLGQKHVTRLQDVLRIKRGISTGCNDFFVLTEEEVQRTKISRKWFKPVLPTRIHLPSNCFSREDWEALRDSNYPCWLFAIDVHNFERLGSRLQEYLEEGIRRGLHATPTAKGLRTWFCLPIPLNPPDVFITYFFRGAPRFILNEAKALNLTNILGGRFAARHLEISRQLEIVSLLNEQAKNWDTKVVGREYKGGLRKIEPKELSMLSIEPTIVRLMESEVRRAATTGSLFG